MRLMLLKVVLLFLLPSIMALETTNISGSNLAVYGSSIAYEGEGGIRLYTIDTKLDSSIAKGSNPSLFGFILAFNAVEDSVDFNNDRDFTDSVVYYYNIKDQSVKAIGLGGIPHVFSNSIFFSTVESDLHVDFNNDGDEYDDILRLFSIGNGEIVNLKAVGAFPVANRKSVAFLTSEKQANLDLNDDEDKEDNVLRIIDLETKGASTTGTVASDLAVSKNFAVFSSDVIKILNLNTQEIKALPVSGNHPAISENFVVFEHDGNLFAYDLELSQIASLDIKGSEPVLFEDLLVFVSDENIVGDLNGDGVKQKIIRWTKEGFEHLNYEDCDSVEDSCAGLNKIEKKEEVEEVPIENKSTAVEKNISVSQNQTAEIEEESSLKWYVFGIILIVAVFVGVYYGYKHHQKRKKSFGF